MKKLILFFFVILMGTNLLGQDKKVIDKIVANVGNEYVLLSDLEQTFLILSIGDLEYRLNRIRNRTSPQIVTRPK